MEQLARNSYVISCFGPTFLEYPLLLIFTASTRHQTAGRIFLSFLLGRDGVTPVRFRQVWQDMDKRGSTRIHEVQPSR